MMLRWVGIDDDCAAYLSDYRNVLAARPGISWRPLRGRVWIREYREGPWELADSAPGRPAVTASCLAWSPVPEAEQLQQVVADTDQQPFLERRRQQQLLPGVVGTEGLAHWRITMPEVSPSITSPPYHRRFSDGLLGGAVKVI